MYKFLCSYDDLKFNLSNKPFIFRLINFDINFTRVLNGILFAPLYYAYLEHISQHTFR